MRKPNSQPVYGLRREFYFENHAADPAGYLLRAGTGLPIKRNDAADVRGLWSYPYYVLEFMLKGGAGSYRNEDGFECPLHYGDFFFVFPGFKQYYGPGQGEAWAELCVSFSGHIFDLYRERDLLHPAHPVWHLEQPGRWIERLQILLQQPRPDTPLGNAGEAARFLAFILEMMDEATPLESSGSDRDWFARACSMLTNNLTHKLDLRQVATNLGMSYHTFRLYFTQRAGLSPAQYRNRRRIETACSLLDQTDKSCKSIAFILGYCSGDHFSADFKNHKGVSPREYRKRDVG